MGQLCKVMNSTFNMIGRHLPYAVTIVQNIPTHVNFFPIVFYNHKQEKNISRVKCAHRRLGLIIHPNGDEHISHHPVCALQTIELK